MANRDRPYGGNTGFVTVFARTPQLCAGALAGLGSALWLNVVGPFAGLVAAWSSLVLVTALAVALVAILAMLVTTAGTLLAADWRADVSGRQAWAEMEFAAAELRLPAVAVAPSQIDPRYLIATDSAALRSVFRAHRFTSQAPTPEASTHTPATSHATRTVAATGGSIPPAAASHAAPRIATKIGAGAAPDAASACRLYRNAASASRGQESLRLASCRAQPLFRAAASPARLVVNGGGWSEWLALDRSVLTRGPPEGHIADIVVLSSDRSNRDQCERFPDPSKSDGTVKNDEPPSCRGPPSVARQAWRAPEGASVDASVETTGQARSGALLADPVVMDNLGKRVPVCAAELDVIEIYLDQVLRDLLASATAAPEQKKT